MPETENEEQSERAFQLNGHRFDGRFLTIDTRSYPGQLCAEMFAYIVYSQGFITEAEKILGEQ